MNYKSFVLALGVLLVMGPSVYAQKKAKNIVKGVDAAVSKRVPGTTGRAAGSAGRGLTRTVPGVAGGVTGRGIVETTTGVAAGSPAAGLLKDNPSALHPNVPKPVLPPAPAVRLPEAPVPRPSVEQMLEVKFAESFPSIEVQVERFAVINGLEDSRYHAYGHGFSGFSDLVNRANFFLKNECENYVACLSKIAEDEVSNSRFRVAGERKTVKTLIMSEQSPLAPFFKWRYQQKLYAEGKIPSMPQEPTLVSPKGNSVALYKGEDRDIMGQILTEDEIATVTRNAGTPFTYRQNLKEVFKRTDDLFFDEAGNGLYYANTEVAGAFASYKDAWKAVASSKYSPASVLKFLPEDSPLEKIFELRDRQIKESLDGLPPEQQHAPSRYVLEEQTASASVTSQRTAEEIKFLLENLPEQDPLRQAVEGALKGSGY